MITGGLIVGNARRRPYRSPSFLERKDGEITLRDFRFYPRSAFESPNMA